MVDGLRSIERCEVRRTLVHPRDGYARRYSGKCLLERSIKETIHQKYIEYSVCLCRSNVKHYDFAVV